MQDAIAPLDDAMKGARLLTLDADLLEHVEDPARRRSASEAVVVNEQKLEPGDRLDVSALARGRGLGVLILSGFVCREIAVADRVSADLSGPEDLLSLAHLQPAEDMFPATVSFVALTTTHIALLDDAFCARVAPWPEILCSLIERAGRVGDRSAYARAIARSSAIEVRVLLSLWHWACWWSSVVPDGVRLAVPLSHERLARLVGATRPTITTAISRLRRAGYLTQRPDGLWLLRDPPNGAATSGDDRLALDSARLRLPPRFDTREGIGGPRTAKRSDLQARLAQQQELLRLAATRHAAQLVRLKERAEKLRATAELSELARQARDSRESRNGSRGE
jgi:CRP-like cAMP-binding protein